jgi:hypothetical protein
MLKTWRCQNFNQLLSVSLMWQGIGLWLFLPLTQEVKNEFDWHVVDWKIR